MRLLLLGLGALALFATEPGKALQRAVVCKFKGMKEKSENTAEGGKGSESSAENDNENSESESRFESEDEAKSEDEHGISQRKAEALAEKLNAKPSTPEEEQRKTA